MMRTRTNRWRSKQAHFHHLETDSQCQAAHSPAATSTSHALPASAVDPENWAYACEAMIVETSYISVTKPAIADVTLSSFARLALGVQWPRTKRTELSKKVSIRMLRAMTGSLS